MFGAKAPLLASRWSNGTDYRFELVARRRQRNLAYLGGLRTHRNSVNGVPVEPHTRVTHIYHREDDEWKIAHRHADYVPTDQTLHSET